MHAHFKHQIAFIAAGSWVVGPLWLAVAVLVIAGTILGVLSLFPRYALEPVRSRHSTHYSLRFTRNGQPIHFRRLAA